MSERVRRLFSGVAVTIGLIFLVLCFVVASHGTGIWNILEFLLWSGLALVVIALGWKMSE